MPTQKKRLELMWIGKEERSRLEPRILLEDPDLSYHAPKRVSENDLFDNVLIHGDNLLALKALEQEFAGKVKCVYIDPPYNTGSAFAEYEDGLEHSLWLSLLSQRLRVLHHLLSEDGTLWVQLDDNEAHYCKVVLDEIFGRQNFLANIIWKKSYAVRSNAQFFSSSHEHLLVYGKDASAVSIAGFERTDEQAARFKNPDNDSRGPWQSVTMTISLVGGARGRQYAKTGQSSNIYDVTSPSGKKFRPPPNRCWSRLPMDFETMDKDGRIWWGPKGDRAPRLKMFLSEAKKTVLPTTIWDDGKFFGFNQDGVREIRQLGLGDFPTPKPEMLLARILGLVTRPGDWVLDSFLGSGTTAAVAHKMGRRWIGVELGEHAVSLCAPRLRKVVAGDDRGGVSEEFAWTGGGGFRFCKLAPSLLEKDKWDNWVVSKDYNAAMLAEAMCKLEGFHYGPDPKVFWLHGKSTETDFIYVTTQNLGREQLRFISDEVGPERTLLVCCAAFRAKRNEFSNLTLRKIPHAVLNRCEWGRDDYSLNVQELAPVQVVADIRNEPDSVGDDSADVKAAKGRAKQRRSKAAAMQELPLFAAIGSEGDSE